MDSRSEQRRRVPARTERTVAGGVVHLAARSFPGHHPLTLIYRARGCTGWDGPDDPGNHQSDTETARVLATAAQEEIYLDKLARVFKQTREALAALADRETN